ncbi:hypothetical protein [Halobaculum limi]|uniref:hypothetical protein n=1 Tax=Halobaculum limi TaxID=3031916 RepID=UPI002404E67E|nr:hypothetical protein [Halobaculum sp. YSMS11]
MSVASRPRAALAVLQGAVLTAFNVSGGALAVLGWFAFYVVGTYVVFTAIAAVRARL